MELTIISGLSGAGKSVALNTLEDLDYYAIDNLPLRLLPALAREMSETHARERAAVGIDARNEADALQDFRNILTQLADQGIRSQILFLEAADHVLISRFSETRRKHPLSSRDISLAEAIRRERQLLAPIADQADLRLDTTRTNVHQLRDLIRDRVSDYAVGGFSLLFYSFGYKHSVPADADFVFDARCLPNPHWDNRLRALTGLDPEVASYLEEQALVEDLYHSLRRFLSTWVPRFQAENRSYMTIAIGCTGGQHRSVYLVERLARHFRKRWDRVLVRHRELP